MTNKSKIIHKADNSPTLSLLFVAFVGCILGIAISYLPMTKLGRLINQIPVFGNKPTKVSVTLGFGETKTISSEGGKIQLINNNFPILLNFPKQSIIGTSDISIKPIDSIDGINSGSSFVGGVDLQADNIDFLSPATLTFSLPEDIKDKKLVAFSYRGNGEQFHLIPVSINNSQATILLSHFSGYGILAVDSYEDQPYKPSNVSDQTLSLISPILATARNHMLTGDAVDLTDNERERIANLLHVWYITGVKPKLHAAQNDPSKIFDAGAEYNAWRYYVQLLTVEHLLTSDVTEGMKLLIEAIKQNVDNAYKQCKEKNDANQAGNLIKLAALAQKFASDDIVDFDYDYISQLSQKCANFRLTITSHFSSDTKCGIEEVDAEGEIPLVMNDNYQLAGKGQVRLNSYSACGKPCSQTQPEVHEVEVPEVDFIVSNKPNVIIPFAFLGESPQVTQVCVIGENVTTYDENSQWDGIFINTHLNEYVGGQMFKLADWEIINSGGIFAKKTYNRNTSWVWPGKENTIFTLYHNPK